MSIVLVGLGSIGSKYKSILIEKYSEYDLYIIDNKDSVIEELRINKYVSAGSQ